MSPFSCGAPPASINSTRARCRGRPTPPCLPHPWPRRFLVEFLLRQRQRVGGGAALDAAVLQHPSLTVTRTGRTAAHRISLVITSLAIEMLENRPVHLRACSHRVFPPFTKHSSPKRWFGDHLVFKKTVQDSANTLTKRASNTQMTPASTSEPCGSADSCPTSGFQLLAQHWVRQGHRNRGRWAKVAAECSVRGCA